MNTSTGLLGKIMSKTGLFNPQLQKERRRSKRYQMDLPLRYNIFLPSHPEITTPVLSARLYDLSEHGLGLLTNTLECDSMHMVDPSPQTSEQCHLTIEIPYDEKPLSLAGKAVWYIQNPEGHSYLFRVGVNFLYLNSDIRKKIATFIELYLSANDGAGDYKESL